MKAIKSILALVAVALVAGLGACSKQTPAEQFANEITKIADQTNKISSPEEYASLQDGIVAADTILATNADYQLTDKDREAIKAAMKEFYTATFTKYGEFQNQEMPQVQIDMVINMMNGFIDKARTLGDLRDPSQASEEFVDDTIEIISDSIEPEPDSDVDFEETTEVSE